MKTIVIVNKTFDGYASGFAAWKKFKDDAKYYTSSTIKLPDDIVLDKETDVYVLGFSYPIKLMLDIHSKVKTLTLIRNIPNPKEEVHIPPFNFHHSKQYSSCVVSWMFFHPSLGVPESLRLIQDKVLKTYLYEEKTENFISGLIALGLTDNYISWDLIYNDSYFLNEVVSKGRVINDYKSNIVNNIISDNTTVTYEEINDNKVAIYNCTNLHSETSNALFKKDPSIDFTVSYQYTNLYLTIDIRSNNKEVTKTFIESDNPNIGGFHIDKVLIKQSDGVDLYIKNLLSKNLKIKQ